MSTLKLDEDDLTTIAAVAGNGQCGRLTKFEIDELVRVYREAASRLQAPAVAEDGWQPIETAPKDGTPVLLGWGGNYHAMTGHFEDGVWGHLCFDWSFAAYPKSPSDWQPLPVRPALRTGGSE